MKEDLLKKYSGRLSLAESVYEKSHAGDKMDSIKQLTIAKCLDNVNDYLNESISSSAATQRSAMGDYKKFCVALTTVALPTLIAFDLVAVSPMSSYTGNVTYVEYVKGISKGESEADSLVNGVYQLGDVDKNYTGQAVVEPVEAFVSGTTKIAFTQGAGNVKLLDVDGTQIDKGEAVVAEDGTVTNTTFIDGKTADDVKKIAYTYDNVVIPQEQLPTLKATVRNIPLTAHARRIAVYYSQIAAFQAKTDYGFNLSDALAEQAVGQLSYEIDTEIIDMLHEAAPTAENVKDFDRTLPVGVSMADHYASFAAKLEEYKMAIYQVTKKFTPNFMVVAPDVMPVISFVPGFQAASTTNVVGPYFAGTVSGLKVFVTPNLEANEIFLGVNQGAMQAAAGVYAPYMPVVPTQLLEYADGGTSQGWSTLYDAKILNANLLVKGKVKLAS